MRSKASIAILAASLYATCAVKTTAQDQEGVPTSPEVALGDWKLPPGFRATLFAAEPDVRQPIGLALDGRGRLWICENETYSEHTVNFDLNRHDRIIILEDADHDGRAESRKLFWDQGQRLTSVEIGFGGVWALCAPNLLFIPDRDGDDQPDGEPIVVLDGWDASAVRHNIVNGLKWGPDGWLYGRHGILATSRVGKPGTPDDQRVPINTGIWRYHPERQVFEAVCHGTTNPWGMDWNEHGEPFFINTVIGHLWHALPGAHFQRMYGDDLGGDLYELLSQTADHFHWDTAEKWSDIRQIGVSGTTDQAGGGHAHSGLMCYLGDNWPSSYRGSLFTINLHGHRLNNDLLARRGAGYVGTHASDFAKTTDPWFRAVDLTYGPDGGVYLADWCDIGECHENDAVHRASGRIFKITYGNPPPPAVKNVDLLDERQLVALQTHTNEWYSRQARRVLRERASSGHPMEEVHSELLSIFERDPELTHKLRALWCLNATNGTSDPWLMEQLNHSDEHVRSWAIRLLVDQGTVSDRARTEFEKLAIHEDSGLVLLYLASALQRIEPPLRWPLARAISDHAEFAADPMLPLMVWYGVEPSVDATPMMTHAALEGRFPSLARLVARRLTQEIATQPERIDQILPGLPSAPNDMTLAALNGINEALRGYRKAPVPARWETTRDALTRNPDPAIRSIVRSISVVFGDQGAIQEAAEIAQDSRRADPDRRQALSVLVESRSEIAPEVLLRLLNDPALAADAVRGLGSFPDVAAPEILLDRFPDLPVPARNEVISVLASKPDSARKLLDEIESGQIDRQLVPVFQIRQMRELEDETLNSRVLALWPELRPVTAAAKDRIASWRQRLTPGELARANLPAGRILFDQTCASCHLLYGRGAKIGPELTGSQRSNLDYLLENLADPSAIVGADFRMSVVALNDGRVLNGVVSNKNERSLTLQTPTERIVIPLDEIEETRPTNVSLMPEGQLELLRPEQVRDLVGYLMSTQQVDLPSGGSIP